MSNLQELAFDALVIPMSTGALALKLGISRPHANGVLRSLRRAERVRIMPQSNGQPVWGRMVLRGREEVSPEARHWITRRWLDAYLDLWQRSMRSYFGPEGYPVESSGFPKRTRINSFEDLEEECDRAMVILFDARIDDLDEWDRTAIYYCCNLTHVWPYADHPVDAAGWARNSLIARLRKWTAVP